MVLPTKSGFVFSKATADSIFAETSNKVGAISTEEVRHLSGVMWRVNTVASLTKAQLQSPTQRARNQIELRPSSLLAQVSLAHRPAQKCMREREDVLKRAFDADINESY